MATGLSFLDRQVLSINILHIQKALQISDVQYGWANTGFLIGYALMFTVGGWLIDRIGGRWGLALAVGIWSAANVLHGYINTFSQLVAFRFLLGFGEGGCFPGAAWVVNHWFEKKERAFANGIAIGGSAIGAVVAPPLTVWLTSLYGWRSGFVLPGLVGLLWVGLWLIIPWKGIKHFQEHVDNKRPVVSIKWLLSNRITWVFIIMRFCLDPVFYFMMFWIPKYLSAERGVYYEQIGKLFWIPFLALGIANLAGGWLSGRLLAAGYSTNRARKTVMGIGALLTLLTPVIAWVPSLSIAIALMALFMLAHGFWITNYITAISDVFGQQATSTVVGLSGTAGAVAALILNPLIGVTVGQYGYGPLWVLSGILYPLAFGLFCWQIPELRRINSLAE